MLLIELDALTEAELSLLFYIVNVHSPLTVPKIEVGLNEIKWFRKDMLIKKVGDALPAIKEEAHPTLFALLTKLGAQIRHNPPSETQNTGSV